MFITFLGELRAAGLPVSITEYLTLLEATEADLASKRVEDFYFLARTCLVKDETRVDKFDRVFAHVFQGLDTLPEAVEAEVPTEWLVKLTERWLSEEDKAKIAALGGLEKLIETLKERLAEQKGRHQGGSKWIGTGGTSPFGNSGYNPEGIRIGGPGGQRRAVKVWEKREFRDLDDTVEIGTRAIKIALRRLRRFARTGAAEELDLEGTIGATARRAYLDVRLRPERHNAVKVLLLLDVGGSMDDHVRVVEELFSAARADHLERTIRPALEEGKWVVCDRFSDSTRVYQGVAGGLSKEIITKLERIVVADTIPHMTLMLDLPAADGLQRAGHRSATALLTDGTTGADPYEARPIAFHEKLRDGFLVIATGEPERCVVLDALEHPDAVADQVWAAVETRLLRRGG